MKRLMILALALVLVSWKVSAQQTYKNLVLEGGGVRGFAYAGAMQVLDSLGILQQLERVGGTSAGAIQATMLALGYTPAEIEKVVEDVPLKEFNDGTWAAGIGRVKRKYGFYKGQKLNAWIEELIKAKTGDADITFLQLHEARAQKGFKDLYITGTDLSYRCLRVFSHESYPNMKIKDALRISFSIPLYFEPVLIDDEGKVHTDPSMPGLHLMVDGGLLSNYPIHIFDAPQYYACTSPGQPCRNMETLGLLLEKPQQLDYRKGEKNDPLPITSLNDYFSAVYKTLIDRPNPDEQGITRTITISDLGLNGRVRKLPKSTIDQLVESGRQAVRMFFAKS